jgi:hypothetical protein
MARRTDAEDRTAATAAGIHAMAAMDGMMNDEKEGDDGEDADADDDEESDVEALMEGLADKIVRLHALLQQQQQQQEQQEDVQPAPSSAAAAAASHIHAGSDEAQSLRREKISQLQRVLHESVEYVVRFVSPDAFPTI